MPLRAGRGCTHWAGPHLHHSLRVPSEPDGGLSEGARRGGPAQSSVARAKQFPVLITGDATRSIITAVRKRVLYDVWRVRQFWWKID